MSFDHREAQEVLMAANAEGRPRTDAEERRARGTYLQRQQLTEADDELDRIIAGRVGEIGFMAIPDEHAEARADDGRGRDNPLQLHLQEESEQPQQPEHDPLENHINQIRAQNSLRNPPANGGQKKKQTRKNSKKYKNKKYKNKNRKHRQTRKTKKRNTIRK